jgi:hypothetical protein
VFNDAGADVDFRVEGDTDANLLFVDASTDRVGIGTTSPSTKLQIAGGVTAQTCILAKDDVLTTAKFTISNDTENRRFTINTESVGIGFNVDRPSDSAGISYLFKTGGTERARITSGGFFKASNSGAYEGATGLYHELRNNATDNLCFYFSHTSSTSPYGGLIDFSDATPNNTTNTFLVCTDPTNDKLYIFSSGTVSNRTGTYNTISDLKLKQDVVDAASQWDDIKALRIVKYRLKDEVAADPNYPAYIGVIAQEVEQVSPGLIDNCPDFEQVTKTREVEKTREVTPAVLDEDGNVVENALMETYTETEEYQERVATGTVTKSVKSSIIYMKAVKALQEAMERIETLEAKVSALEGN